MTTTKIKAIYQGEESSLGFKVGTEYVLSMEASCQGAITIHHDRPGTLIGYQTAEYASMRAFLMNWKNLNYTT